ncbi:phosphocholine cytidylyltransferase family protein [candidate division KSB1 bacterium]|nr:phosphocholine cytidylyltransferase family protein [candidate division KSB1 bacterium]MBL7094616.1 phosphocholine cytidylyltransferase family protein [candidate division KSB1 bacterium]
MKALILASGLGIRLNPLTEILPKCLVKVVDKTILDYQLNALYENGIKDVIITTGHLEHKIKNFIKQYEQKFNFTLVHNEVYDKTNYIYSIYKAKEELDDEIILIHGDLVFDQQVLTELLKSQYKNSVIIEKDNQPQSDFKGAIENDKIKEISIHLFDKNCFFLAPFYKFSKTDFSKWLNKIEEYVIKNQVTCYAEDALNELLGKEVDLHAVYLNDLLCMEVDDVKDLEAVRNRLLKT